MSEARISSSGLEGFSRWNSRWVGVFSLKMSRYYFVSVAPDRNGLFVVLLSPSDNVLYFPAAFTVSR